MPVTSLVLTLIGKDRPGLVEAVSRIVSEHQGNWEASHLAYLSGRFAGIVEVKVPEERAEALAKVLQSGPVSGLRVTVDDVDDGAVDSSEKALWIELVGSDQPNIVRDISAALAQNDVTVVEMNSELAEAPVAGGKLFKMHALVRLPTGLELKQLRASLEELANSLMVDLRLDDE